MPIQVQPFNFGADIRRENRAGRGINLRELALGQREQQIDQRERQIDIAAQRMGLSRQEFGIQLMRDAIAESPGPEEAIATLNSLPFDFPEQLHNVIRTVPKERFGTALRPDLGAQQRALEANLEGLTPEQQRQARNIELGLEPRAVGSANLTIAGNEAAGEGPQATDVAEVAGTIKAGEEAGKSAIEQSNEAIKQLSATKKQIANIDDAIAAIDAGANTGAIASRLPSITQASIELDNARARLGLDIIGSVTFGALSEGELRLALDTAIPSGLEPAALRAWLVSKKDAQEKLARELEGAAVFLGQPGNTPAKYLQFLSESGGFRLGNDVPLTAEEEAELRALEEKHGNAP